MYCLEELERALALHNEAEHLRQEYIEAERVRQEHLRATSEKAAVEEALSQVEDLRAMLPTQEPMSPEVLLPRRPEPMRIHVEVVVWL